MRQSVAGPSAVRKIVGKRIFICMFGLNQLMLAACRFSRLCNTDTPMDLSIPSYREFLGDSYLASLRAQMRPVGTPQLLVNSEDCFFVEISDCLPYDVERGSGISILNDVAAPDPAFASFVTRLFVKVHPQLNALLRQRVVDRNFLDETSLALSKLNDDLGVPIDSPDFLTIIGPLPFSSTLCLFLLIS